MSDKDSTADGETKQKTPPARRTFTPPKRNGPPEATTEQSKSSSGEKSFGDWLDSDEDF